MCTSQINHDEYWTDDLEIQFEKESSEIDKN